jgi:hypothetical protein
MGNHTMYQDEDLEPIEPTLGPGEKLHIPVPHDELILRLNALQRRVWVREGKMLLCKKGHGHAIHISDFIVEETGQLVLTAEQLQENAALPEGERLTCTDMCENIYPGKNHEGWWNTKWLITQVWPFFYHDLISLISQTKIKYTIPIFEWFFPNAIGEFIFDQSSAHSAFVKDALNAKEMNVNSGGKQHHMHSTVIPQDNPHPEKCGQVQSMVFLDDLPESDPYFKYCGQAKGMHAVLEERGV